ncbi:hypothetical protein M3Y94_00015000 [Aphelenchoides besseyi]|nr:hypothetical protein M3Y94_00015000 [Aphelenchoides besseyi]KAI6220704.1 hypothetical protein M3Y95_01024300 [Aphelenchoides besseyi]
MRFGFLFVLLFGTVGSTWADGCFTQNGETTTLNSTCAGSTTLVVKKQELVVNFDWPGYKKVGKNPVSFNFGGCVVDTELKDEATATFSFGSNYYRTIPLKIVVGPSNAVVEHKGDMPVTLPCTANFTKIDETTYTIDVKYSATKLEAFKGLSIIYSGTIYEPKTENEFYQQWWFWVIVCGVIVFILGVIIAGVVICFCCCKGKKDDEEGGNGSKKSNRQANAKTNAKTLQRKSKAKKIVVPEFTGSEDWVWQTGRYTQQHVDQLMAWIPIEQLSFVELEAYIKAFLQQHPVTTKAQLESIKYEVSFWIQIAQKDYNDEPHIVKTQAYQVFRLFYQISVLVVEMGQVKDDKKKTP